MPKIGPAAAIVADGNIHEDAAGGGGKIHDQRFHVLRAAETLQGWVIDWGMDFETKALVVERGDGVADD